MGCFGSRHSESTSEDEAPLLKLRQSKPQEETRNVSDSTLHGSRLSRQNGVPNGTRLSNYTSLRAQERVRQPVVQSHNKPVVPQEGKCVSIKDFPNHVVNLHSSKNQGFMEEYFALKRFSPTSGSKTAAQLPQNRMKNRYADIVPYDHSRVHLFAEPGIPYSDYINASLIDGYKVTKEYIATQAPLPTTACDFWRMVWEQRTRLIVRLTKLKENVYPNKTKVKCFKYWPDDVDQFSGIEIQMVKSLTVSEGLIINTFQVRKGSECRKVEHLSFLNWPDHGVPENVQPFLNLVQWFDKLYNPQEDGRPIIHCSAGIGRTGTLICVRSLIQMIEEKKEVDVFNFILKMRQNRINMVQTEMQYIFIHDALLEYLHYQ